MDILSVPKNLIAHTCDNLPITNNTCEVFLGKLNDDIIGYIIVNLNDNSYSIEHFYVDEAYRNAGLGQRLLKSCLDNYGNIRLMVGKSNHVAIHIYQKFGFRIAHSRRNYYIMLRQKN